MRRVRGAAVSCAIGVVVAIACGKSTERDGDDCPAGTERCPCYGNESCDGDLECRSGLCVEGDSGGPSSGGRPPTGGVGPTTGGVGPTTGGVGPSGRGGTTTGGVATGGVSGAAGDGGEGATDAGGAGDGGAGGTPRGGAGSGGKAGSAGSAGTTCGPIAASPSDTLIDDLEDNDNAIAPPRVGYWYTYSDGTCAITPPPDPSGADPFEPMSGAGQDGSVGARVRGSACATWGAGMGFDLNNCGSRSNAYSAQAFNGISFWYKSVTPMRLIFLTTAVIPTTRGGACVPGGVGQECDNGHGFSMPASPSGATVWIPFSQLTQEFGQMKVFDKTQIHMIQWQVTQGTSFDFSIDDISFVP